MKNKRGFTLIEILIYSAIFTVTAIFLVNILTTTSRIQSRQTAVNELNQQISFVASTIERLVRNASLIENPAGVASTTLVLRTSSSGADPTKIYVDASNTAIYVKEGTADARAITNSLVKIGGFQVVKYENPGGRAVVQVDLTLQYNSDNPQFQFSRNFKTAITRVSAANFDFNLIPNANNAYDLGSSSFTWRDAYFSGNVGIGTTAPGAKLSVSGGDIVTKDAGKGLIVKRPDGAACYRIFVDNNAAVSSTAVTCP